MARLIVAGDLLEKVVRIQATEEDPGKRVGQIIMAITDAPAADAAPVVHGEWKPRPHHKLNSKGEVIKYCDFYYCSVCGTERPILPPYNYCPNCGAKMDGVAHGK